MGIPCGNTVALVGDPGTGKTSLLLLFFRHAQVFAARDVKRVRLADRGSEPRHDVLQRFDQLMASDHPDQEPPKPSAPNAIRVFVSMDNTFESVWRSHGRMLGKDENGAAEKDRAECWFFIDAASMLSGRLQDDMRYPRLSAWRKQQRQADGWKTIDLSLGGWNTNSDDNPVWFWVRDGYGPTPVADIIGDAERGAGAFGSEESKILLRLLTPYLPNPLVRVRLLKDLIAALFSEADRCVPSEFAEGARENKSGGARRTVVVAIDSLTSMLAELPGSHPAANDSRRDRLQILNVVRWLEELGVTTMFSVEAHRTEQGSLRGHSLYLGGLERYLASGVIQLDYHQYISGDVIRYLQVLKMRGTRHDMRPYAYDIDENGLSWLVPLIADREGQG